MDYRQSGGIDLHIHSTASDGTHTPREILAMAARLGLQAIAITDHDTLDGSRQALTDNISAGLNFITGVEISVQAPDGFHFKDSLHILGYGIDSENEPLVQALNKFKKIRNTRIHRIVEQLNHLGIPLELQHVMAQSQDGTAGRPHVATAMVMQGFAKDINDAFDRYLGNGRPACIGKERMTCETAFELIDGAGGVPVLAHPYLIPCKEPGQLTTLIRKLCDLGLRGLEVYYPRHTPEAIKHYLDLVQKYDLLVTGGTDFHGDLIPEIELGRGEGDLNVPFELYEKLISARPNMTIR